MELFEPYSHAIAALAGTAIMLLVMGPLTGRKKASLGLAPGATPEQDYGSAAYRWHRAHANLAENVAPFVAVTAAAVLAGCSPFWVNLLASLFLVVRLVLAVVHINGIGKPDMSVRSFTYVAGWLICLILGVMAILSAVAE